MKEVKTTAGLTPQDDVHWFEKFTSLLEANIRGVQIGIYSVAFCGLGIALRSVRPFKKFTSPKQIPKSFFDSNIKLNGKVLNVDVTTRPLLLIDHFPIIGNKFRSVGPLLPVELEGVNISQNGICWLQTIVKNQNVEFILLEQKDNSVSCIVTMKKRNIAKHLVSLGFASVAPFNFQLKSLPLFVKYYEDLIKTEDKAERKGNGIWTSDQKRFNLFDVLIKRILPLRRKLLSVPFKS